MTSVRHDEADALARDAADPLSGMRQQFHVPLHSDRSEMAYLCGHSLGLQPRGVPAYINVELDQWASLGVEGHFDGDAPWYSYHETVRDPLARIVGALPIEVVAMNSLTVNLHLMLTTFYRPTRDRHKILIDGPTFPSDLYAVQSQIQLHGYDPREALVSCDPLCEDIIDYLTRHGSEIAMVLLNGVNFVTGHWLDMAGITAAAQQQGCICGWDLAHAAGNVPLRLHDWNVDFAVWCSYKYLNGGPGTIGGCFVHERHGNNLALPRLAGWWGNDPATRFRMHLEAQFVPQRGADGWQLSNPPILALAPLRASMLLFERVGMQALRERSERLTGYLEELLQERKDGSFEILTPREPSKRGCQLSLRFNEGARERVARLRERGIVADFREPDIIRLAPVPLYNSHCDIWRVAAALLRVEST